MKKVLVIAVALLAVCNFAFADLIIDTQLGGTTNPGAGGAHKSITIDAGSTAPIYMWVYAKVTNGPQTADVAALSAMLYSASGKITETTAAPGAGVHGNFSLPASGWYTSAFSAATKPVANLNPATGDMEFSTPGGQFQPYNDAGSVSWSTWVTLGKVIYTPLASSKEGTALLNFVPDTNTSGSGALYAFVNGYGPDDNGDPTVPITGNPIGGNAPGYATTGACSVTINAIPEPSTLVLLGMASLALLAIRRRK